MAWGSNSNPVEIGEATKKVHYDDLWDKLQFIRTDVIPAAAIMLFGQITVQGWTRKADWQDDSALIYSASGALGAGGSAAASTHTHTGPSHSHKWFDYIGGDTSDLSGDGLALDSVTRGVTSPSTKFSIHGHVSGQDPDNLASFSGDRYTSTDGTGATGAATAYYQEVAAFTKDTYT